MDELFIYVELKEKSFEKYIKARNDVEKPGWHKISNRLLEDDELWDFTAAETCAWLYILSQSSIQQKKRVRLTLDKVDAFKRKFNRDDFNNAIKKLTELGVLDSHVTSTARARNVDVPLERIREDKKRVEEEAPPAIASQNEFTGVILPALAGNSKREQVLARIPLDLQQEWVETYDLKWLKDSLLHAVQVYSKTDPVECIQDWPTKLVRWFKIEKKPKYKISAGIKKPREPATVHGLKPLNEIIGKSSLREALLEAKTKRGKNELAVV